MPIEILSGSEIITIRNIIGLLFGQPGVGKTSSFFTAAAPLLFDFDQGAHRSQFRRDIVQVSTWEEIAGLDPTKDFGGYETIGIDTTGRCLDALMVEIIREDPKAKRRDGSLSIQGWGSLKNKFVSWLKLVQGAGLDVVLLAHDKEERKGDDRVVRPDIQGGSYAEVFKRCDFIGYSFMDGGRRMLDFNPTDEWVGKNPGGFERLEIPDFNGAPEFLARIIADTKDRLGQLSEGSVQITKEVEFWRSLIGDIADGDQANNVLAHLLGDGGKSLSAPAATQVKALLWQKAKSIGLAHFGDDKGFVVVPETEAEKIERLRKQAFEEPAPGTVESAAADLEEKASDFEPENAETIRKALAEKGEKAQAAAAPAPESDPVNGHISPELPAAVEGFDLTKLARGDVVEFLKDIIAAEEPTRVLGKVERIDGENLLVVPVGKSRPIRVPLKPSRVQLIEALDPKPPEPTPLPVGSLPAMPGAQTPSTPGSLDL